MGASVRVVASGAARATDSGAGGGFGAVHAEHAPGLLAYAARLTGDRAVAEEIVQETFLRAWRHAGDPAVERVLGDRPVTRAWLFVVARNLVFDLHRRRAVRPVVAGGLDEGNVIAAGHVAVDHADAVTARLVVTTALARLGERERRVVELRWLHGHSNTEAAAAMGVPAATARVLHWRALRHLRALIAPAPQMNPQMNGALPKRSSARGDEPPAEPAHTPVTRPARVVFVR